MSKSHFIIARSWMLGLILIFCMEAGAQAPESMSNVNNALVTGATTVSEDASTLPQPILWQREVPLLLEGPPPPGSLKSTDSSFLFHFRGANGSLVATDRDGIFRWSKRGFNRDMAASTDVVVWMPGFGQSALTAAYSLQGMDAETGHVLWTVPMPAEEYVTQYFDLHIEAGRVFLFYGTGVNGANGYTGVMEARSLTDGSLLWRRVLSSVSYNFSSDTSAHARVHQGRLVLPLIGSASCSRCLALYAFDLNDGAVTELWREAQAQSGFPEVNRWFSAFANGRYALGKSTSSRLAVYDLNINALAWEVDQGANMNGVLYTTSGLSIAASGDIFVTDTIQKTLTKYATANGVIRWRSDKIRWRGPCGLFSAPTTVPLPNAGGAVVVTRSFEPNCTSGAWRVITHKFAPDGTYQGESLLSGSDLSEFGLIEHNQSTGIARMTGLRNAPGYSLIDFDVPSGSVVRELSRFRVALMTDKCGASTGRCVDGNNDVLAIARPDYSASRTATILLDAASGEPLPFPLASPIVREGRVDWVGLGSDYAAAGQNPSGSAGMQTRLSLDSPAITQHVHNDSAGALSRQEQVVQSLPDGGLLAAWYAYDVSLARYCQYAERRDDPTLPPRWSVSYCASPGSGTPMIALQSEHRAWLAFRSRGVFEIDLNSGAATTNMVTPNVSAIANGRSGELWVYLGSGGVTRSIAVIAPMTAQIVQQWNVPGVSTELVGFVATGSQHALATMRDITNNSHRLLAVRRGVTGLAWDSVLAVAGSNLTLRASVASGADALFGGCATDQLGDRAIVLSVDASLRRVVELTAFDDAAGKCIYALEATSDGTLVVAEKREVDAWGTSLPFAYRLSASRLRRDEVFGDSFE